MYRSVYIIYDKFFHSNVQDKRDEEGMWFSGENEYCLRNFVEVFIRRLCIDTGLPESWKAG